MAGRWAECATANLFQCIWESHHLIILLWWWLLFSITTFSATHNYYDDRFLDAFLITHPILHIFFRLSRFGRSEMAASFTLIGLNRLFFLSISLCVLISRTGNKIKTNHNEIDTPRPSTLSARLGVEISGIAFRLCAFSLPAHLARPFDCRSFGRFLNFIRFVLIIWITFQDKTQKSHTSNRPVLTSSLLFVFSAHSSLWRCFVRYSY